MSVDAYRLVAGVALSRDLPGPLREGSGYLYQYAARLNVLRQLLVTALYILALSSAARGRVASSSTGVPRRTF